MKKNYALVIGIGDYDDNAFSSLPSENDAVKIKDYLINEAGFDHVRLITGDMVTLEKIRSLMIDHYSRIVTEKDRFLFYWAGHGVTSGIGGRKVGYLPVKQSPSNSFSTMLSMRDLSNWDKHHIKARQTLYLLDSCFSGMAAITAMSQQQEHTIQRVSQPSSQILAAGLENQQTIAIDDLGGGVFTRALLDGLRGQADVERGVFKKDGVVTARELEAYTRLKVDHERRRVNWPDRITPTLYNFSRNSGDFFFISDKRKLNTNALLKNNEPIALGVVATGLNVKNRCLSGGV